MAKAILTGPQLDAFLDSAVQAVQANQAKNVQSPVPTDTTTNPAIQALAIAMGLPDPTPITSAAQLTSILNQAAAAVQTAAANVSGPVQTDAGTVPAIKQLAAVLGVADPTLPANQQPVTQPVGQVQGV